MPRSKALNIEALLAALKEQSNNAKPGVTPSAFATNAYLGDQPLSDEQSREQDVLDAGNKRYLDTRAADSKRQSDIADAEAADVLGRFNSRTGVQEDAGIVKPSGPKAFTPENFPPVASHAQPALRTIKRGTAPAPIAPQDRTDVSTEFGTSPETIRTIRRFANDKIPVDPDAARSELQKAMDSKEVLAAQAKSSADKLTKVEHKDPNTGRTVIEWLPESTLRGQTFQKGEGATAETRLASAQAVNQTGDDMIAKLSDPTYAKQVGVAMGRYNSLRNFIGNPPPEFADLAGMIESYSLASMGVHGMRSAQGAQQINKLLDEAQTPESLIAKIRGLNNFSTHFMQNEGRMPASTSTPARGSANITSITPIP